MSCLENDRIYEAALERAKAEDVDEAVLCDMHIDDVYDYLQTGRLPEDYERILYRLYK